MKRNLVLSLLCLGFALLLNTPLAAQDTAVQRDPAQLASRLLGWDGSPAIPDPTPLYNVGDETQFWVSKAGQDIPVQVNATLAASTPELYLWVEEGLNYDPAKLGEAAGQLEYTLGVFRIQANQGVIQVAPQTRADLNAYGQLMLPDVDNDPHLFVLFARDVNTTRNIIHNPVNSAPTEWVAGGYTNQHETLVINTTAAPRLQLDDPAYASFIVREYHRILTTQNIPGQAAWLREALSWYMLLQWQQSDLTAEDIRAFMDIPETSLTVPSGLSVTAGQLFLNYLRQRFGAPIIQELAAQPGEGMTAVNRVLERSSYTDLVTGQPLTAEDLFADFVMTNLLNRPIGDGRFFYRDLETAQGMTVIPNTIEDQFDFQAPNVLVTQFGANYVAFSTTTPAQFTLFFDGAPATPRLPIPGQPDNHLYWSGNGLDQNTSLTRPFDLTGVAAATLQFDAWYELSRSWNYGYVSVSADNGQTWQVLNATSSSTTNPNALGYGPAFTGISNPEPPQPFPYLGIGLEPDGLTIANILEASPFLATDVKVGDTIAGFDGAVWEVETPNLLAFLSNFVPGDTVNLHMKRGEDYFDVDVVLGSHPTRVFNQDSVWVPQLVDLSAYAGKQILLRFDYVSADATPDRGFAIDNIAIPEINYLDDAEAGVQGWTLNGWQQITNEVRQRYLVQYALVNPSDIAASRIERLIGPQDRETSGSWEFSLQPGEFLVLAVSGLNTDTDAVATYTLSAQSIQLPETTSS